MSNKLTKGQINVLISVVSNSVRAKRFGTFRPASVKTVNLLLERGLVQISRSPAGFLSVTPAGVDALRGLSHEEYDLPALIKRWDAEAKASVIVEKIEAVGGDAYRMLSQQQVWPAGSSFKKSCSVNFFGAGPPEIVDLVIGSISEAQARLPEDILKLRRQLIDLEQLLEGVNKIDAELRTLGVHRQSGAPGSGRSDDGDCQG
jgi:DNA-binding MarR family transcriptional regulator